MAPTPIPVLVKRAGVPPAGAIEKISVCGTFVVIRLRLRFVV
jgi:hypothetical protein